MILYAIQAEGERFRKQAERWCLPALRRLGVPDERIHVDGGASLHDAYNRALDWAAQQPDLSALVLLHPDMEILAADFEAKAAEAISQPEVMVAGVIGAAGVWSQRWWEGNIRHGSVHHNSEDVPPGVYFDHESADVDVLDGCLLVLHPWMVQHYRADTATFEPKPGTWHAASDDLCLTVKRKMKKRCITFDAECRHHTTPGTFSGGKERWDELDLLLQRKHGMGQFGKCAAVITVCGRPELLDLQFRSHRIYSPREMQFVVVDATKERSKSARKVAKDNGAFYVESPGTPQGVSSNKGIEVAARLGAEWLVLANDDLVVGPGWHETMMAEWDFLSRSMYRPGILGASSNYVAGKQARVTAMRQPTVLPSKFIVSFFALTRADVMQDVGGYGPLNNGSDLAMSYNLAKSGYTGFVSSAFVHHFGSQSFAHAKVEYRSDIEAGNAYMDRVHPDWKEVLSE
jgi:hypothetical protein